MVIDGVEFDVRGIPDATEDELKHYLKHIESRTGKKPTAVTVALSDDGKVDLYYDSAGAPFERIRRITGYLVGTIDRWNNAKKAEERERVKHG